MRTIGRAIWWLSETLGVNLGMFGPTVLGWMIGVKGRLVKKS